VVLDDNGDATFQTLVRMKVLTVKKVISTLLVVGMVVGPLPVAAQSVIHQTVTVPGGVPGVPVMSGITAVTNGMQITWNGPAGYYQVFQKSNNLAAAPWIALGKATNLACTATITKLYSNAFFRVSGPTPKYAGYKACIVCHQSVCRFETNTPHASAFANLPGSQQQNPSCLACHTVGYGLPTGFVSASATPQLEGVQCENCHGPAANHAARPDDPTVVPRVDLAAQICGGCHSGSHQPTYEEWSSSGHSAVVPDVLASMSASTNSISSCGRCHSGSARLALIAGMNPSATLARDYNVPITCAVCHAPHALSAWTNQLSGVITFTNTLTGIATVITNDGLGPVYTNQLRSALASTEDFVLTTSAVFTNVYNPNINVCGQCHNARGAAWTDTSRAPHHSPQYNMLLGTVGELLAGPTPGLPATHSRLEKQCAECHMQTTNSSTGHTFDVVTYQLCYNCHTDPAGLVRFATKSITGQIQQTKFYLDYWATNVVPVAIPGLQKYGVYAWEYTSPGDLSPGGSGPSPADQKLIPDEIKKARFDLYLVLYDGSYGVHNAPYDVELLQSANAWVLGQISINLMSNVIYVQSLF
jgi:hypothetical protein